MYKLLIVDDESYVRNGLMKHIDWQSLEIGAVNQANDGISALTLVENWAPDIIITDIRMPNMTGIEFAKQARMILPDCKIIFISAYSDKSYFKEAIHLKAISYVEKPIDIPEVIDQVKIAVASCKKDREFQNQAMEVASILKNNELMMKSQWLLDAVKAKGSSNIIHSLGKEFADSKFIQKQFFISVIQFFYNEHFDEIRLENLNQILRIAIGESYDFYLAKKNAHHYIILIYKKTHHKLSTDDIKECLSHISQSLICSWRFIIGSSDVTRDLNNMNNAYTNAIIALQHMYYGSSNQYTVYQKEQEHFQMEENIYEEIRMCLRKDNMDQVVRIIHTIVREMRMKKSPVPNLSKEIFYKIVLVIFEEAKKRAIILTDMHVTDMLWEKFIQFNHIAEVEDFVKDKVKCYFNEMNQAKSSKKIINDIIRYVNDHYSDTSLSIKLLSKELFLSEVYLCVVFKEEMDMTINQYIRTVRIEKAKELFLKTHHKIYEVASLVGYQDHNYFSRLFKKATQMTPSEYKERYNL